MGTTDFEDMGSPPRDNSYRLLQLSKIADKALNETFGLPLNYYGERFGWQACEYRASHANSLLEEGVENIERIAESIHNGWVQAAKEFIKNPFQFSDSVDLEKDGSLCNLLINRDILSKLSYSELSEDCKEENRVIAKAFIAYHTRFRIRKV